MLTSILRFEWRYHTRQTSFAAAVLLYAAFGFTLTATGFGPDNVNVNSPYSIAQSLGMASLASVFAIAVFCANAVVRDRERQMEEIVFSTPVGKFPYLFGRFTGSFLAAFTAFTAAVPGMIIASKMPWQPASRVGPLDLSAYLWALLVLVLPGMLAAGVALFGIATLTRSVLSSVVGAVAIYVLYFVAATFTNSPLMAATAPGATTSTAALLLDPFGLSPFFEQTEYWTAATRNSHLLSLSGSLLANRLLWLAFAGIAWLIVYRRFTFRVLTESKKRAPGDVPLPPSVSSTYAPAAAAMTGAFQIRAFFSQLRLEIRASATRIPFILLSVLWAILAASEIVADVAGGEYGAAFYPTTGRILTTLQQPLFIVGTIVIIYYGAEIVWRERAVGIAEIVDGTPANDAVFVLAKWTALSVLVVSLTLTGIVAGAVVQLARGYTNFEPSVMLAFCWFSVAPLIVFALAAVVVQTLTPAKYTGMILVLGLAILSQAGGRIGLAHPLLRLDAPPAVGYSNMNGFGQTATAFNWLIAYWFSLGALALLAAIALRRLSGRPGNRLISARQAFAGARGRLAAAFAFVALSLAAWIFYNTNVRRTWESPTARLDWRAEYEKLYRSHASEPQPVAEGLVLDVAFDPQHLRSRMAGTLTLVNRTMSSVGDVFVSLRREANVEEIKLDGVNPITADSRFGMYRFHLEPPLAPGKRSQLRFAIAYDDSGFGDAGGPRWIETNGTYLDQRSLPAIGYRPSYEIRDADERRKRGLPVISEPEAEADVSLGWQWIDYAVTLSTSHDQIALAPGLLERRWTKDARNFFHYTSSAPLHYALAFASARYAVERAQAGNVGIDVEYDPAHRANVQRIIDAARRSLAIFADSFGPYPNPHLTIAEVPGYLPFGGFATPGLIFLNEDRAFLIDARDGRRLDLVTRRTAHEVAHQWWGHLVTPGDVAGASAIVESLTKYAELLVIEKTHGSGSVRRSLAFELDRYLRGRADDRQPEVPLARVENQAYLYYGKGAIVMHAIADLIGEPAMNRALHDFAAAQGGRGHAPDFASLFTTLSAATPPEDRPLLDDWTRAIIIYDLRLTSATSRRLSDGRYEVKLRIDAARARTNGGAEEPVALDERIDVGVYAGDPDEDDPQNVLYLAKQSLHAGPNELTIVVSRAPLVAAVDPTITRIDRSRFDNTRPVTSQP